MTKTFLQRALAGVTALLTTSFCFSCTVPEDAADDGAILSNTELTASAAQYLMGDVDTDGGLDATDAASILGEYVKTTLTNQGSIFNWLQRALGDVDHSGAIDATDALSVLQYYVAGG